MAKITFKVLNDGTVDIDISGVVGASCEDISKIFQNALGGPATESNLKPEYYTEIQNEYIEAKES